jgi:hypothetical protein
MLEKDEPAAWPQDTPDASYGLHDARNGAEREGAHNRINAAVLQGYALPREVQELDIQLRSAPMLFCEPDHPRVGFERVELAHSCGIVVHEVDAGTYADFEDCSLSQGDDSLANFLDGLRVAQHAYEMRVNMISVEGHSCLLASCAPQRWASGAALKRSRLDVIDSTPLHASNAPAMLPSVG